MKSFNQFLVDLNDGSTHAGLTGDLAELDKKATALSNFIGTSETFPTLDAAEQERLKEQNDVMWRYSEILGARIAAFS